MQYLEALDRGVTTTNIQKAIEIEVANKKASSGLENPFKYMRASYNWLKEEDYQSVSFEKAPIITNDDLF